jgi:hypothetical protein
VIFTSLLPWFAIISLLIYVPVLCYLDWKHRDIGTHKLPIMLALTIAFSLTWFLLLKHRGADCVWLICITMFAIVNPRTGMNFIQPFLMYLIIFTAATFWGIWLDNRFKKHVNSFSMENGIPFLIPISLAFVAAVVM